MTTREWLEEPSLYPFSGVGQLWGLQQPSRAFTLWMGECGPKPSVFLETYLAYAMERHDGPSVD